MRAIFALYNGRREKMIMLDTDERFATKSKHQSPQSGMAKQWPTTLHHNHKHFALKLASSASRHTI
jgi:hypothetical protein